MAEIQIVSDDCESERGKRGRRGHRGDDGATGTTGPTGPAGGDGAFTTEHVAVVGDTTLGDVTVSFVTYAGPVLGAPTEIELTLPPGTVDGQQRQVSMNPGDNVVWQIVQTGSPAAFTADNPDAYMGAIFVWDAIDALWAPLSLLQGSIT